MHHFFVEPGQMEGEQVRITGPDVNHMKNALRMKAGEQFLVSDGQGGDYLCRLEELDAGRALGRILEKRESAELPSSIWLYQGLPKSDKMEFIIQKAAELGAAAVVPVVTRNTVVKLDAKKAKERVRRWQAIAESGAKQSKRSRIPQVGEVLTFEEALNDMERRGFDFKLVPYENQEGMAATKRIFDSLKPGMSVAVMIGPEGGFDPLEIEKAQEAGAEPISLGRRILRTETAAVTMLSALMLKLEEGI